MCGARPGECPWVPPGAAVAGTSWHDRPHLCQACATRLTGNVVCNALVPGGLPAFGCRRPSPELVAVLGQWKYHGVRGLAWPLAALLTSAMTAALAAGGAVDVLVPVPLHGRRRRERGFNQAEILARLAGRELGLPVAGGLLRRCRRTDQQARLGSVAARRRNLAGAFVAGRDAVAGQRRRVGLVDDLITSGATCVAAREALTRAGWQVCWTVALGVAAGAGGDSDSTDERRVDTVGREI